VAPFRAAARCGASYDRRVTRDRAFQSRPGQISFDVRAPSPQDEDKPYSRSPSVNAVVQDFAPDVTLPDTRLLIDGQRREALSGKRFTTLNPATGGVIAEVAEAEAADIDIAVK